MSVADELYGVNLFGEPIQPQYSGPVAQRFVVPPFTVLDTRQGFWQDRRRAWLALGIESEIGRDPNVVPNGGNRPPEQDGCYRRWKSVPDAPTQTDQPVGKVAQMKATDRFAFRSGLGDRMADSYGGSRGNQTGVSIFDPVLCELVYRWFCPPGGQVLDPFAGGSVRGIVAGLLGFAYWGCDLSGPQIAANGAQHERICPEAEIEWHVGDAAYLLNPALDDVAHMPPPEADLIFSCPPYGDLELYSDDPHDLSLVAAQDYEAFSAAYERIIGRACRCLKPDRFACFVVADFRDRRSGNYRGFIGETVRAFAAAGLTLYNEAILVNAIGSLPIRITEQFEAGRKLGKTHQNVLIFLKGNWRAAAAAAKGPEPDEPPLLP